ncbi:MAG: mechanosensitive ion channel family protein [Rhizobiaceae bacterium]|nr:mechanosensitive ion channel family protein [Rhizobiaceae bacterium]
MTSFSFRSPRANGLCLFLALLLVMLFGADAGAQEPSPAATAASDPIAVLDAGAGELGAIVRQADAEPRDESIAAGLRDRALQVEIRADEAVAQLVPRLEGLDARIAELGEVSQNEAPDVKAQRSRLDAERSEIDSAIKRGRILSADARQTTERLIREITEAFNRNILQKVAGPLSPTLWMEVAKSFSDDSARILSFAEEALSNLARGLAWPGIAIVGTGVVVALALLFPVRRHLRQIGRRFAIEQVPGSRARRSALAFWFVLVGTASSTFAFLSLLFGLLWAGALSYNMETLAAVMTLTACVGSYVVSLGAGLLLVGQASWRLIPLSEAAARRLRSYPGLVAALTFTAVTLSEGGKVVGIGPAGTIAINYAVAFTYVALIVAVLLTLQRLRRAETSESDDKPSLTRTLTTVATMLAWISVAVALVAGLQGYVNIALFIGRQTIWIAIVAASAYLLLVVADDLATTFLSGEGRFGRYLHQRLGIRRSQIAQAGVIVSALLRLGVAFLAVIVVTAPFGPGASSLFYQFAAASALSFGGITIVPGAILKAALALVVGIAIMRFLRHWLNDTYLPTTELDPGARNSVVTIVSYAGIIIAVFWAINSLGIGAERIALVVSALSVGIGFGLQAITQNFISGLILLAERPVKIGDTVRIGADEGDVKRISVRSTEIQIADRSTLIVPNSELITKTIRNMTLANPLGRIQIAFTASLEVDPAAVRKGLLDLYGEHPAVLREPSPSVFIDGIDGGAVRFNSFAFVSSPRDVYGTRSALLFSLLERFRTDGIVLVTAAV